MISKVVTMAVGSTKQCCHHSFAGIISKWFKRLFSPPSSTNARIKTTPYSPLCIPPIVTPPVPPVIKPQVSLQPANRRISSITIEGLLLSLGAHEDDMPTVPYTTLTRNNGHCRADFPQTKSPPLFPSLSIPADIASFQTLCTPDGDYTQKHLSYSSRRHGQIFLHAALQPFNISQRTKRASSTITTYAIPAPVNPPSLTNSILWETLSQPITYSDSSRVSLSCVSEGSSLSDDRLTLVRYIRDEIALDCNGEDIISALLQHIACDEDQEELYLAYHHNSPGDEIYWTDIINIDDY
ncbi:hypothetical protein BD779DRAFT_1513337 [Infundibulicybe gibba]|nr:hypothetical protein BD779DRAFT_1513337 [Infundibulicybe gibba]